MDYILAVRLSDLKMRARNSFLKLARSYLVWIDVTR